MSTSHKTTGAAPFFAKIYEFAMHTFRTWQASPGHNANLLKARADSVGIAFARNEKTRYRIFWAMVIAEKAPNKKVHRVVADGSVPDWQANPTPVENPINSLKNFV